VSILVVKCVKVSRSLEDRLKRGNRPIRVQFDVEKKPRAFSTVTSSGAECRSGSLAQHIIKPESGRVVLSTSSFFLSFLLIRLLYQTASETSFSCSTASRVGPGHLI